MNHPNFRLSPLAMESLEARYALRVTARLTDHAETLGTDFTERLRVAREQALQRARQARLSAAPITASAASHNGNGSLVLRGLGFGSAWWMKAASALPILALIGGLVLIQRLHVHEQIAAAAEIDSALLADELPPSAYSDAGFAEFLKAPKD